MGVREVAWMLASHCRPALPFWVKSQRVMDGLVCGGLPRNGREVLWGEQAGWSFNLV